MGAVLRLNGANACRRRVVLVLRLPPKPHMSSTMAARDTLVSWMQFPTSAQRRRVKNVEKKKRSESYIRVKSEI